MVKYKYIPRQEQIQQTIQCACGCGNTRLKYDQKGREITFIHGHNCTKSIDQKFWSKVNKTTSCWIWTGAHGFWGYGAMNCKGHLVGTHRYSWELHFGTIPNGMMVLHKCDVPSCVNPSHLFLGTQLDNIHDAQSKDRLNSKLTNKDVCRIRNIYRFRKFTYKMLAKEYDVNWNIIRNIVTKKTWKNI